MIRLLMLIENGDHIVGRLMRAELHRERGEFELAPAACGSGPDRRRETGSNRVFVARLPANKDTLASKTRLDPVPPFPRDQASAIAPNSAV